MSNVPPRVGVISGMYSWLQTAATELTAEKVAWGLVFLTFGVVVYWVKNVYVAKIDPFVSILLLAPMVFIKFITGYLFVPVRNALTARLETRVARFLVKCFVYAVDMTFGWAVTAVFFVKWPDFVFTLVLTFVLSFIAEPFAALAQWAFQGTLGALFPLLRKQ